MENKYFYFIIGIITIISSNITIIVYSYVIKNNFKIKKIQGNSENYKFLDSNQNVQEHLTNLISKLGENIVIRKLEYINEKLGFL